MDRIHLNFGSTLSTTQLSQRSHLGAAAVICKGTVRKQWFHGVWMFSFSVRVLHPLRRRKKAWERG